jgi:Chaperone of endosialidase
LALSSNTAGYFNTATGANALAGNTTGRNNTATGTNALQNSTTGQANTGIGFNALQGNTTGEFNAATGYQALFSNTVGYQNTATGPSALLSNTTGTRNTAYGAVALSRNTSGSLNIAVGFNAGVNLTTGSNNIDIGVPGTAGESGKIRIGKSSTATGTFIAGIWGKTVASGVGIIVNSSGQLGTVLSSARFKTAIEPMDKASETILALKPVTFRYKHELDPDGIPQFGLVAEQVEKVNPDLVARDEEGRSTPCATKR